MARFDALKPIVEGQARGTQPPQGKKRVPGKRQHPDYQQISLYMRRDLYAEARRRLIGSEQDFSELVNKLVNDWLQKK